MTILLGLPSRGNAATLVAPSDYITDDRVNETNVTHNVGFYIPESGHDILATDYILIELTNFGAVTAPTSGSGWAGVPTFGVTGGNTAYVTNVTASAGTGIGISGITATNPADSNDFDVTIKIANDIVGSVVYDTVTFDATALKGSALTSVTVSADTSSIDFFGFTSPGAFVTIKLNGAVAATTTANPGGNFHDGVTGLTADQDYAVAIFAVDTLGRQTRTVNFTVHTLPFTFHIINNIVLPTTIETDKTDLPPQDTMNIFGRAHPSSQVTVFINNPPTYSQTVMANTSGYWNYTFDSRVNPLVTGTHSTYAREVVTGGFVSIFTDTISFNADSCRIADLNCDGYVNLVDFSILMYYWGHTNPANSRADINNDTIVNLTDFSIMLYHWTG